MRVLLSIAARNLVAARRRNFLLGLAIALVTMMLVLLTALSHGIHDNMVRAATTISAGQVNVAGFFKPTTGVVAPFVTHAGRLRAILEAETPGLDYIVERHRGWGKIIGTTGSMQVGLTGLVFEEEGRFFDTLQLAAESEYVEGGRPEVLGDPRGLARPNTVILFATQAKRIGVGVGDQVTITTETSSGLTNTGDATVVAVARDLGLLSNFAVFVPKGLVLDLYQVNEDTTGAFWIYLDDIDEATAVMNHLRKALVDNGYNLREHEGAPFYFKLEAVQAEDWSGQQIDITIWQDEVSFLNWVLTGFDSISWTLTFVLVVIIAVGIMNGMWTAVRERTREIGTMRAIGMRRRSVVALFVLEAFLLGLLATTAGAAAGSAAVLAIDAARIPIDSVAVRGVLLADELHLALPLRTVGAAIASLTLFTVASSLWPSIQAGMMRPVQALHHAE